MKPKPNQETADDSAFTAATCSASCEAMYQRVIGAILKCDPIPAHLREDDTLEPPWEVIDRIREERDQARKDAREARDEDADSDNRWQRFSWEAPMPYYGDDA